MMYCVPRSCLYLYRSPSQPEACPGPVYIYTEVLLSRRQHHDVLCAQVLFIFIPKSFSVGGSTMMYCVPRSCLYLYRSPSQSEAAP